MSEHDEIQLVTFRIDGHGFAFNVFQVERILRYEEPAFLPKAPDYLEGTLRRAAAVVPVVDLRKRLEVAAPVDDDTRIMILEWEEGKIGVVVDAVLEVLTVPADQVALPPPIVKGLAAKYISGIVSLGDRVIVVLAASKLLTSKERLALGELTADVAHE